MDESSDCCTSEVIFMDHELIAVCHSVNLILLVRIIDVDMVYMWSLTFFAYFIFMFNRKSQYLRQLYLIITVLSS